MRSKEIKALMHKIGLEFNLRDSEMREIVESQFKFLRDVIASGDHEASEYKNFRLANIGLFYVSDLRKKWEQRNYYKKEHEEDNSTGRSQK